MSSSDLFVIGSSGLRSMRAQMGAISIGDIFGKLGGKPDPEGLFLARLDADALGVGHEATRERQAERHRDRIARGMAAMVDPFASAGSLKGRVRVLLPCRPCVGDEALAIEPAQLFAEAVRADLARCDLRVKVRLRLTVLIERAVNRPIDRDAARHEMARHESSGQVDILGKAQFFGQGDDDALGEPGVAPSLDRLDCGP